LGGVGWSRSHWHREYSHYSQKPGYREYLTRQITGKEKKRRGEKPEVLERSNEREAGGLASEAYHQRRRKIGR